MAFVLIWYWPWFILAELSKSPRRRPVLKLVK